MGDISSKDKILSRIREGKPASVERPDIPIYTWPGDPVDNFKSKLQGFDGKALEFGSRGEAVEWLKNNIDTSRKIYSAIAEYQGNVTDSDVADPHNAHNVDICVGEGLLGVGETGSIWVTNVSLGLAACALLSTDLYLLLDKTKILGSLQDAYENIDLRSTSYGSFFTGPSATADIEAVHITGAQGEISLTALLY